MKKSVSAQNKGGNGGVILKIRKREGFFYGILAAAVAVIGIRQILAGDVGHSVLCGVSLVLIFLPLLLQKYMKIYMPGPLAALLALSVFASAVLGEVEQYYLVYPHWDTVLHGVDGFVTAALGFALMDVMNHNPAFHFVPFPKWVGLWTFCFSMTVGLIWEFVEFLCDWFLKTDMQKDILRQKLSTIWFTGDTGTTTQMIDIQQTVITGYQNGKLTDWTISGGFLDIGLLDTMQDLLACGVGALIFVVLLSGYLKTRRITPGQKNWIPKMRKNQK